MESPRHPIAHTHRSFDKVFKLHACDGVGPLMASLSSIWQQHYADLFTPGLQVMVKINLNSSNPYPASTSPEILKALLEILRQRGITDILVGACSANGALPTRRQAKKAGILDAVTGRARLVCFDEEPWVTVPISGYYLKHVTVPQEVMRVDRIISLANMKTHKLASFTLGMKLAVGFMHPLERITLHQGNLQQKVTEIQLAVPSDLTIIDGRLAFITGGPDKGEVSKADLVIMGSNPLAVDIEAYKALYALKKKHRCLEGFAENPLVMAQFSHAMKLGIGGGPNDNYQTVEVPD
ncbi:MAG: DUF362 domain-containing protein [Desulfoferrobacter sp.]